MPRTDSAITGLLLPGVSPYDTSRDSVKTVLKLTLDVMAQRQSCNIISAYSVKVVLKPTSRVIAQKQSCGVYCVQRESSVDSSTRFARENVKPDPFLVSCYARGSACSTNGGEEQCPLLKNPDELHERRRAVAESRLTVTSNHNHPHLKIVIFPRDSCRTLRTPRGVAPRCRSMCRSLSRLITRKE